MIQSITSFQLKTPVKLHFTGVFNHYFSLIIYILPIALVSAVNKKGRVTQNHSGLIKRKARQATRLTKVIIQYFPVEVSSVFISLEY